MEREEYPSWIGRRARYRPMCLTRCHCRSAAKVAQRLGIQMNPEVFSGAIRNCDDVQQLLDAYRAGTLSEARMLLVQAHLGECGLCLRHFREGGAETAVDWARPGVASRERVRSTRRMHPHAWGWALALSCMLLAAAVFGYKAYWQVPLGIRAEVQSIDGAAYLISVLGNTRLAPGAKLLDAWPILDALLPSLSMLLEPRDTNSE